MYLTSSDTYWFQSAIVRWHIWVSYSKGVAAFPSFFRGEWCVGGGYNKWAACAGVAFFLPFYGRHGPPAGRKKDSHSTHFAARPARTLFCHFFSWIWIRFVQQRLARVLASCKIIYLFLFATRTHPQTPTLAHTEEDRQRKSQTPGHRKSVLFSFQFVFLLFSFVLFLCAHE